MKTILTSFLSIFLTICQAQTLVNKLWQDTTGHPVNSTYFQAAKKFGSEIVVAGSTYRQGQSANVLITKYTLTGTKVWQNEYIIPSNHANLLSDVCIRDGMYYLTGTSWDSANFRSRIFVCKGELSTGDTLWVKFWEGAYAGYHAASSILVDGDNNIYVGGTEQESATNFRMLAVKFDSDGYEQWVATHDSAGYYDGIVGLQLNENKNYLSVTGFSGSGLAHWDFVSTAYTLTHGVRHPTLSRNTNGNGAFSQPIKIAKDYNDNAYVAGTAAISVGNTDIKIIKYDTMFNEVWVRKWGGADSLKEEVAAFAQDRYDNMLLTGYTTAANGAKSMVVLKYNTGGTLLWSKIISAPNPTRHCVGKDIVTDDSLNVYVTGSVNNGIDNDMLTICYDKDGNLKWQQVDNSGSNINDEGSDVLVDSLNNVYISGVSQINSEAVFLTIKYQQQIDSLGLGVIIPAYVTDRIKYSDYVFEGTVIQTNSYFNQDSNFIYTSNTIEVNKMFKGGLSCGTVELITLGGTVDSQKLLLSHNVELNVGEKGIFLAKQTTRELSTIDFYVETNEDKLYMPYNEEGFIKYYYDGINPLICQQWGKWNTHTPLYNLLENTCGEELVDCEEAILPPTEIGLQHVPYEFPHYSKQQFDAQMSIANERASRAIHSVDRALGTITYNFSNPVISGTSTKYLEFDVQLSDNLSAGWFDNGVVHILYSTSVFGTDIVTNNKIEITRGTVIASADDYMDPIPNDYSTGVVAISMVAEINPLGLYELTNTPTNALHVKMEIANCNVPNVTISMTNNTNMLNVSLYSPVPNPTLSTNLEGYGVVDNTSTFAMPACKSKILSFSPAQLNAGVGDTLTIRGYQFGAARGTGKVYLRHNASIADVYVDLDAYDYASWSDTMIKVVVPSLFDPLNNAAHTKKYPGSGLVKMKADNGDTSTSTLPLSILYSAGNSIDSFNNQRKKCLNNLVDYRFTGGYRFRIDSSIYNHPNMKGCFGKALHDWVCLTAVNFELGADTISTTDSAVSDRINMVQMEYMDDSLTLMRTYQYIDLRCDLTESVAAMEMDIVVNRNVFNELFADTNKASNVPPNMYDTYELFLHELGHAHSLFHVNDVNALMYFQTKYGPIAAANRKVTLYLDASCVEGGPYIITESQNPGFASCPWQPMSLITTGNCEAFTSATNVKSDGTILVYPNPSSETINIEFGGDDQSHVEIEVYNIIGNLVYAKNKVSLSERHIEQIQVNQWTSGFYLLNVKVNDQKNIVKIIKN